MEELIWGIKTKSPTKCEAYDPFNWFNYTTYI